MPYVFDKLKVKCRSELVFLSYKDRRKKAVYQIFEDYQDQFNKI
jgi:hypothetical protein